MPLYRATVTSTVSWTVQVLADDEENASDMISQGEGKRSAINSDFPEEICDIQEIPTDEEVEDYRQLHNADESGINDQWDSKQARYYLELEDEWYDKRKA